MIPAHKRMRQEVQDMAGQEGVQLPSELSDDHKQKMKEFSQLTGHAFDREYMQYILWDHQRDVQEFEGKHASIDFSRRTIILTVSGGLGERNTQGNRGRALGR